MWLDHLSHNRDFLARLAGAKVEALGSWGAKSWSATSKTILATTPWSGTPW